ncbi:hypothetical protein BDM02DRAFT_3124930 [Thelephora ganbajun]|uniref:Uncharacterized protein n=1 Tax=Thelephora ganbajun TaxID=370292 RepID=A0ACB6YX38_THEGA|nr:hypothetical protein BDM02DRAFT_3124930 [Thelephora ganbajun]
MDSGSMTTWEVGFASPHTPTRVESPPIPHDFRSSQTFQFHPTSSRFVFTTKGSIVVWDAQHSKSLLSADLDLSGPMSFSSDGRFFACGVRGREIHLWKESPTGYILHQKFIPNTGVVNKILVSPDGESIIALDNSAILLWRIGDSITSLSDYSTPTVRRSQNQFILRLSPDGALAAVARTRDETVTVLDLNSGIPRLTIDTGMRVSAVGVAGSVVAVVGEREIVTWNLLARNEVPSLRANVNDSVLTTRPNCPLFHGGSPISVSHDLRRIATIGSCQHDHEDNDRYKLEEHFPRLGNPRWSLASLFKEENLPTLQKWMKLTGAFTKNGLPWDDKPP